MADTPTPSGTQRASHVRSFSKDLERLSGKRPNDMTPQIVAPKEPVPAPKPTPVPAVPAPEPIPLPPLSVQKAIKEDLLGRLKDTIVQHKDDAVVPPVPPAAPPVPATPVPPRPAPIHTYKSDFADNIDKNKASVFSVLAADKDAMGTPSPKVLKMQRNNRTYYLVGVMLILLGLVGVYAAVRWANNLSVVPMEDAVPSLVFADSRKEIGGSGDALLRTLADAGGDLPQGSVLITYVTTSTTTEKGVLKFPQPGATLIRALPLSAPDILLRNIEDISTVGVIHAGEETRAFFVLRVSSYERTFAGMLEWEKTIARNLATLYPDYPADMPVVTGTTTASTTEPVIPAPRFVDDVVASRDVRALKDYRDRTILLYGYHDKATLIIARDEQAFAQLAERLSSTDTR